MGYKFNTIHPSASGVIDKARPIYRADTLQAMALIVSKIGIILLIGK